jgi:cytochrome c peroxidase
MKKNTFFAVAAIGIIWSGCQSEQSNLYDFPQPTSNVCTEAGVMLGKQLFYDKTLSVTSTASCATCHIPQYAFADTAAFSRGVGTQFSLRHTPTLINLAWAKNGVFWDGGVKNLESVSFAALQHTQEMGQDLKKLPQILQKKAHYQKQFKAAFQTDSITNQLIGRALAQYLRTLIFNNSKYDAVMKQKDTFSLPEKQGFILFEKHCSSCHTPPHFTDFGFHKITKDSIFSEKDEKLAWGRGRITNDTADIGKFKTPSLRHITQTAPYLHDARCDNLEQVILAHNQIVLSLPEIKKIIRFLHTLQENPHL